MTLTHDTETLPVGTAPARDVDHPVRPSAPKRVVPAHVAPRRRRGRSQTVRVVRTLTSAAITGCVLVLLATNFVLPTIASHRGMETYSVLSGSMEPFLHTRTTVLVDTAVDVETLGVGDPITFATGRNRPPTTHRVIEVFTDDAGKTFYRTQGDANEAPDGEPVSAANVIGVVHTDLDDVWTAPGGREIPLGQAVTWTRTTEGRVVLIAPAVASFVLGELAVALGGTFMDPRTWSRRRKDA